jgi:CHAT domain-containing protein
VASLWKVDDQATAALMVLFYDKLWRQKKSALVALREAQLTLYHHPERIKDLATERGPKLDKIVRLPIERPKEPTARGAKASPKLWAGFVLSGIGK